MRMQNSTDNLVVEDDRGHPFFVKFDMHELTLNALVDLLIHCQTLL